MVGRHFAKVPKGLRLLAYPPSRRLHGGLYRRWEAHLAGEEDAGGFLRILTVGPLYGGSHPIACACARGFKNLGHRSELLDFAPFHHGYQALKEVTRDRATGLKLTQDLLKFLGEILLARVRDFRPDVVFFLAQAPVDQRLLRAVRQEGTLLAYWFVEDYQVFSYWRDLAPEVDAFFTIQREPLFSELKKLGLKNYSFLPLAADPEVYRPLSLIQGGDPPFRVGGCFCGGRVSQPSGIFSGIAGLRPQDLGVRLESELNPGAHAFRIMAPGSRKMRR